MTSKGGGGGHSGDGFGEGVAIRIVDVLAECRSLCLVGSVDAAPVSVAASETDSSGIHTQATAGRDAQLPNRECRRLCGSYNGLRPVLRQVESRWTSGRCRATDTRSHWRLRDRLDKFDWLSRLTSTERAVPGRERLAAGSIWFQAESGQAKAPLSVPMLGTWIRALR